MTDVPEDFVDLRRCLNDQRCEFLVVGAYALAIHGAPRATGDIDVFVRPTGDNAPRVMLALQAFGAPLALHGIAESDFSTPGVVYQLGLPPRRIDLLTQISGVSFDEANADAVAGKIGDVPVRCIGLDALLANKRAAGRAKDLADATLLEALIRRRGG